MVADGLAAEERLAVDRRGRPDAGGVEQRGRDVVVLHEGVALRAGVRPFRITHHQRHLVTLGIRRIAALADIAAPFPIVPQGARQAQGCFPIAGRDGALQGRAHVVMVLIQPVHPAPLSRAEYVGVCVLRQQ